MKDSLKTDVRGQEDTDDETEGSQKVWCTTTEERRDFQSLSPVMSDQMEFCH